MIRVKKKYLILLVTAITMIFHLQWLLVVTEAHAQSNILDKIQIKVHKTNAVKKDRVYLRDIADVQAGAYLLDTIKAIEIGRSPKPGRVKTITGRSVRSQIESRPFLSDQIKIDCPDTIFIKRTGQKLERSRVEDLIKERLADDFPGKDFEIKELKVRGLETYPDGDMVLYLDKDRLVGRSGKFSSHVAVFVDDARVDKINISGRISLFDTIVFTNDSFSKGKILNKQDVYEKEADVFAYSTGTLIHNTDEIQGKVLKSDIRKDRPLDSSDLITPPLIRKGDVIKLIAKFNNLKIVTSGISREDGFVNDLVEVENLYSGKVVRGIVKEKSEVEVVY